MRLSERTPIIAVLVLILAVVAGVSLWYVNVRQEAQTEQALVQTREAFERFERERQVAPEAGPSPGAMDAAGASAIAPSPGRAAAATPDPLLRGKAEPRSAAESAAPAGNARDIYYLLAALLLTAVVALALAGSTYRLVQRERRVRMEEGRVMRETAAERSSMFRASDVTIIDAEPVDTVADGTPVYSPEPPPKQGVEQLREWMDQSPLAVVLMLPTGEIEAVNHAFTRLTGYTVRELPNIQTWLARLQRIAPDRQSAARDALREHYTRGTGSAIDMTVWTRAGEPRQWIAHVASWRIDRDSSAWLLLGTDITERRQKEQEAIERAESACREADELAEAYQAAPIGLAVLDSQMRFVRVNDRLAEMDGLRAADHLGKPLRKLLPHVAAAAEPLLEDVLRNGAPAARVGVAVRTPASPKADRHWTLSCAPLRDVDGRATRLALAAEDVTEHHEADARMRENESALRTILEHLPAPVCVKDPQGRYVYANPAYERFVQAAPGQLKGRMDHEVLPWEAADRMRDADEEALASPRAVDSRGSARLRDAVVHYAASKIALRDRSGAAYAVCAVYGDWTAQQQTEHEIRATEARYRSIFETSPQPMLIDRDNKLTHVNAACMRLLAASDEGQLLGRSILEFIQPPGHKPFQERIQQALRRKPAEGPLAVKVLRLDGKTIHAEIETALYETPAEKAVQIVVRDVTERMHADEALRASEAHLRSVVEDSPSLIRIADAAGSVSFWNGQWQRYTGVAGEHALGERWTHQIHAQDRDRVERGLADTCTQREAVHLEYRLRDRTGSYRWVLDVAAPRFDDAGTYLGYVGAITDIDELKRVEDELKRDSGRLRAIADLAPAMLWTESAGRVDLVNATMREQLGLGPENADEWTSRIHPDDREEYLERRRAVARDGDAVCLRVQRADGEYRWMLASFSRETGPAEGTTRGVGSLMDITDLRRAQSAAREADQRRNAFLSALASELRTPLEPLRHAAEVLRLTSSGDPRTREASDIVVRHAQYLARRLDEAIDVSRFLEHAVAMQPEVTDLGQLVHHAVEDARPLIEARRLSLNIRLPGGRAHVYADPQRFTQALTGLLDFAARRADEGGAIALTAEEADGTAAIHVTVDGLVLPDADAASLFELFAVTAGDPTRSAGGLTLPLVRELLVRQGGAVDVDADDHATRFSLRLPVYDPATRPAAEGDRRRLNGHRRVLVIDRDPDTAASLSMLLQLQGHDVRVANDRQAAIPAAQAFHPDTVMIDSAAAEGGPGELVRALRLLPETAHAALLCLSADAADDPAREALFDHYLLKPVEPHLLQRLLAQTSPTVH